ncbi:MAG TPA: hypothetical protein VGY53_06030, partial [Isosphaeraceae bacterium]|nr:hypothetical protein [Isosphaeraceae bacterium]
MAGKTWRLRAALFAVAVMATSAGAAPAVRGVSMVTLLVTFAIVAVGAFLVARQVDVRLVLLVGALPLFALAGMVPEMFRVMAREMANHRTVVPICSALGFAYVLRLTECDQHLVQLLMRPLRRVRALLVPGGIAAGYLVNSAVVSQTGAAAVVGPILVPLLRAGGYSATTAGGLLLLGCSMGGELFNPGVVEIVTLAQLTGIEPAKVVDRIAGINLLA